MSDIEVRVKKIINWWWPWKMSLGSRFPTKMRKKSRPSKTRSITQLPTKRLNGFGQHPRGAAALRVSYRWWRYFIDEPL